MPLKHINSLSQILPSNQVRRTIGATLGGMAGHFLKAAAISTDNVVEMMKLTKRQIEVTMFAAGVEKCKV